MTTQPPTPDSPGADPVCSATTVLERLLAAGVSESRARAHLAARRVRVAGLEVEDPDYPAPWPTRYVIAAN